MTLRFQQLTPELASIAFDILQEICTESRLRKSPCPFVPRPDPDGLRAFAKQAKLFVVFDQDPVATFGLDTTSTAVPFPENQFTNRAHHPLYVSKLGVSPTCQGRGIGTACLEFIYRLAYQDQADVVRLYAVTAIDALRAFYEQNDFSLRGEFTVSDGKDIVSVTHFENCLSPVVAPHQITSSSQHHEGVRHA